MCMKKGVACVERRGVPCPLHIKVMIVVQDKRWISISGLKVQEFGFRGRPPIPEGCRSYKGFRGPATDGAS